MQDDSGQNDEGESASPRDLSDYGRAFARLGEPFTKIHCIVEHGLAVEAADSEDEANRETNS